ncbi:MAG: hypothetical protein GY841_10005, partial [FCB group bacterium]|nr:hypothetical protein [FCB group bacterium]
RPEIRSNKPDATISATLNGGAFLSGTEIATTGDYTIEATVTDSLGRVASSTVSFRLDLEAGPSITITSPQDGETLPDALTAVNGTVTGNGVTVTVNGSSATVAGDTWTISDLALQPAVLNDIRATAIDLTGRSATASITVMVRTGGPQVLILEPADRARTNRERIDVAGVVIGGPSATADGTVTVAEQIVNLATDGTFRALDVPLAEGDTLITVTVTATDPQSRTGQATVTIVSDQTPPTISLLAAGQPLAEGAVLTEVLTITVEVSDPGSDTMPAPQVRLNGSLQQATGLVVGVPISDGGGYLLAVVAEDTAGNQTRIERSFLLDLGACSLSELEPSSGSTVTTGSVTIRGRSGDAEAVTIHVPVPGSEPVQYTEYPAQLADGTFVAGDVPLPEIGNNSLEIVCSNAGGDTAAEPLLIKRLAEGGGPEVRIEAPTDGTLLDADTITVTGDMTDANATVTINGVAATVATEASADDGRYGFTATILLVEGPSILAARAVDLVGRIGKDRVVILSDTRKPTVQITSPTNGTWLGPAGEGAAATVTISGLVDINSEPHLQSVTVSTDQGSVVATIDPDTGAFIAADVPLDGSVPASTGQTVTVTATDSLGHQGIATIDLHWRATGPAIVLSAPADLTRYDETSPAITISGEAWAHEGAQVAINGTFIDPVELTWSEPAVDGRRYTTFSATMEQPTTDGSFGVLARVTELDGSYAQSQRRLLRDTVAPEVVELA